MRTFGERLKSAFGSVKNKEIARIMGVSESAVSNYMAGRVPDADTLISIKKLTNCDLDWLITGNERPSSKSVSGSVNAKLAEIAREQARHLFAGADIAGGNAETRTLEILKAYLISRGMQEYNLLPDDQFLMDAKDRRLAEKFSFVREKQPDIEERFRQIIQDELAKAGVGAEPDSVEIEDADMILAPVIAHISSERSEELLRKTG